MNYNVKDLVKDKRVQFSFYRENELWYKVAGTNFEFPVNINDVGNGIFLAEDKAILFMRWIRKHVELIKEAKSGSVAADSESESSCNYPSRCHCRYCCSAP